MIQFVDKKNISQTDFWDKNSIKKETTKNILKIIKQWQSLVKKKKKH